MVFFFKQHALFFLLIYVCLWNMQWNNIRGAVMQSSISEASCFRPMLLGCAVWVSGCLHWFRSHQKLQWIFICVLVHSFLCSIPSNYLGCCFSLNRRCSFLSFRVNWVVLLSTFYHDLPRYRNIENLSVMTRQAASSSTVELKTSISPSRGPLPYEISAEYSLTANGTTGMNTKQECQPVCR